MSQIKAINDQVLSHNVSVPKNSLNFGSGASLRIYEYVMC